VGSTFTIGCISYISYVGHGWVMGGGEGGGGGEGAEINQRRGTEIPIAYIIGVGRPGQKEELVFGIMARDTTRKRNQHAPRTSLIFRIRLDLQLVLSCPRSRVTFNLDPPHTILRISVPDHRDRDRSSVVPSPPLPWALVLTLPIRRTHGHI
jgi:hypothetical protein